jgi:small subunit ribosomal protein S4
VVYKLGFADSRSQARQLILHGHILVNDHKVNLPSSMVDEGDVIKWREGSKKTEYFKTLVEGIKAKTVPAWLSLDRENLIGKVESLPSSDVLEAKFEPTSVVEWYSR